MVSSQEHRALLVPLINRLPTAGFVPPSVGLHGYSFVVASGETFTTFVFDAFAGTRHEARLCPARINLPGRPAKPPRRAPTDPTRPSCVRVLDSTGACQLVVNRSLCSSVGLHKVSHVRASEESFRRFVFGTLGGTRDGRLLGQPFCRRSALPRRVPRPNLPMTCSGFGFDRWFATNKMVVISRINLFRRADIVRTQSLQNQFVEPKTRTYHERVESGRTAGRQGGAK